MLGCWAAKPVRPLDSALEPGRKLWRRRNVLSISKNTAGLGCRVPDIGQIGGSERQPEWLFQKGRQRKHQPLFAARSRELPKNRGLPWRRVAARELACSGGCGRDVGLSAASTVWDRYLPRIRCAQQRSEEHGASTLAGASSSAGREGSC